MSDIQTCIASFVVVVGAQGDATRTVDQHIEAYLLQAQQSPVQALVDLRAAFDEMRLDGRMAAYISSRIDMALATAQSTIDSAGADRDAETAV